MRKGLPVSAGVAVARAYCLSDGLTEVEPHYLDEADLSAEVRRFAPRLRRRPKSWTA